MGLGFGFGFGLGLGFGFGFGLALCEHGLAVLARHLGGGVGDLLLRVPLRRLLPTASGLG